MSALANALFKLSPTGKWKIVGEAKIENIEWEIEPENKPTDEEIQTEVVKQEKLIKDTQYQRDRAEAYPELKEQLDLLWHAIDGGKFNVKSKETDFYKKLKAVKDANPKPE